MDPGYDTPQLGRAGWRVQGSKPCTNACTPAACCLELRVRDKLKSIVLTNLVGRLGTENGGRRPRETVAPENSTSIFPRGLRLFPDLDIRPVSLKLESEISDRHSHACVPLQVKAAQKSRTAVNLFQTRNSNGAALSQSRQPAQPAESAKQTGYVTAVLSLLFQGE